MTRKLSGIRAVILDLDGVLTDTARTHRRAWKRMFDEFLRDRRGADAEPFSEEDYRRYVDGKPRYDGAVSFLEARDIELPYGDPDDDPGKETVCGLGNRKNEYFRELLEREGVDRIEPSIRWARVVRASGVPLAVVTSSRNGRRVLEAAGIEDLFDARVDGRDGDELGLPGKPDPAYFLEAADRLDVPASDAAVVEDAESGVEAGRRGGFGIVIGVGSEERDRLRGAGTDLVIEDLSELPFPTPEQSRRIRDLPLLMDHPEVLECFARSPALALLLDYDGTLTPIVDDPDEAQLPPAMRDVLEDARTRVPLAVISGRDLDALREFVGIDGICYAASHGLHIREPDGAEHERAAEWLPDLNRAEQVLEEKLRERRSARIERKRFAIAVHYRNAPGDDAEEIQHIAEQVGAAEERLRITGGKQVVEIRPDIDWDKGSAVQWILDMLDLESPVRPIVVGDDVTDEDAFRALPGTGLPVVVRGEDDDRTTAALFALEDPDQVRTMIRRLMEQRNPDREDT